MKLPTETPWLTGVISTYVAHRGFGYIVHELDNGEPEKFFFHHSELKGAAPEVGLEVTFTYKPIREGRNYTAVQIKPR